MTLSTIIHTYIHIYIYIYIHVYIYFGYSCTCTAYRAYVHMHMGILTSAYLHHVFQVSSLQQAPLMTPQQIAIVEACIGSAGNLQPKFHGVKEDLSMGDPTQAAFGLEAFLNIEKTTDWFAKIVETGNVQEKEIEAEMSKLAQDMQDITNMNLGNGKVTNVFNNHLHYLTRMEGIKECLQVAGQVFQVVNWDKLCSKLYELMLELVEFLEYVIYMKTCEKTYQNGVRDKGRPAVGLQYFKSHHQAVQSNLT
jgi:hypothetical protein